MTPTVSNSTSPLSASDRRSLALELRRELARVEGGTDAIDSSDARDEFLLALQRLDDGSYGMCIDCDRQIPVERLHVMPATRWCVSCAR